MMIYSEKIVYLHKNSFIKEGRFYPSFFYTKKNKKKYNYKLKKNINIFQKNKNNKEKGKKRDEEEYEKHSKQN